MNGDRYVVSWGEDAESALLSHKKFIKVKDVYKNAINRLSTKPLRQVEGIVNYPGYSFNGYYWANINNAIILFRIDDTTKEVYIDACESSITGDALRTFYLEYDPMDE